MYPFYLRKISSVFQVNFYIDLELLFYTGR